MSRKPIISHMFTADPSAHVFEGIIYIYPSHDLDITSPGTTHLIAYAVGDTPYGPFTYKGTILTPVAGWTTHHSIDEFNEKWYLYYHDSSMSGGLNHKRCVKMAELEYNPDGTIITLDP